MPVNTILKDDVDVPIQVGAESVNFQELFKREADVIVTSVILGFTATRYHLGQPCQFDYELEAPEVLDSIAHANSEAGINEIIEIRNRFRYSSKDVSTNSKLLEVLNTELKDVKAKIDRYKGLGISIAYEEGKKNQLIKDINLVEASLADEATATDAGKFMNILDGVSYTLGKIDQGMGRYLQDGQSVHGGADELIGGIKGGAHKSYKERQAIELEKTAEVVQGAKSQENWGKIYAGRGAYTGVINDPVTQEKIVQPTIRVKVKNADAKRWKGDAANTPNTDYWQFVGTGSKKPQINLSANVAEGMGAWTGGAADGESHLVGYVHGMCSAIQKCRTCGPWAEPFELATGNQTTKISSCFPCTTYMYATGYPPSSSHLGRGESWVPPASGDYYEQTSDQPGQNPAGCQSAWVNDDLSVWHRDIYNYLILGFSFLEESKVKKTCIAPEYHKALGAYGSILGTLRTKLNSIEETGGTAVQKKEKVANLFLDALTVHDKEQSRLARVLKPACDIMLDVQKRMFS